MQTNMVVTCGDKILLCVDLTSAFADGAEAGIGTVISQIVVRLMIDVRHHVGIRSLLLWYSNSSHCWPEKMTEILASVS